MTIRTDEELEVYIREDDVLLVSAEGDALLVALRTGRAAAAPPARCVAVLARERDVEECDRIADLLVRVRIDSVVATGATAAWMARSALHQGVEPGSVVEAAGGREARAALRRLGLGAGDVVVTDDLELAAEALR